VIIDELPTIYFRGLDNLIATARSKVAVCLGFQDYSQLTRGGDKESKVIQNTVGNIFSGQEGERQKLIRTVWQKYYRNARV
jgi:type IV secretory pathway TraG/TraD family ATPase VirD4